MKYITRLTLPCAAFLIPALASAQVIIQFGGDATHLTDGTSAADIAWASAIGADQVIQWNGVNSDGGSFGSAGTLANQGVGASLNSLGAENLILTTIALSAANETTLQTSATNLPNFVGVDSGADSAAAQFESGQAETWTFNFNQDVTFIGMISVAMAGAGEVFGIDIGADGSDEYRWDNVDFNIGSGTVSAGGFGGTAEYYATFAGGGVAISAGTDIKIYSVNGSIGLEGLVVSAVPEPSTFALLAGIATLGLVIYRRRRI
ncbi:MAG: PEP-CTERM sorting domain-containing protein [Puniceicoccaceae bacterium]